MTWWARSKACAAGDCIEVFSDAPDMDVWLERKRDGVLIWRQSMPRAEWDAFTAGVKAGDFDHLEETP